MAIDSVTPRLTYDGQHSWWNKKIYTLISRVEKFLPHCSDDDEWESVDDYELEHAESPSTAIEQMVIECVSPYPQHPFFFSIAITCFFF